MRLPKYGHLCYLEAGEWYHSLSCPCYERRIPVYITDGLAYEDQDVGLGSFGATGLKYSIKPDWEIMREDFRRKETSPYNYIIPGMWKIPVHPWGNMGKNLNVDRRQSRLQELYL